MTNLHVSYAAANAQASALAALAAGGSMVIYSGTQPPAPENLIGASVVLATFTFSSPAFGAPVSGQLTLATPAPASIVATGTAIWFRVWAADGITALFDGNIGTVVNGAWAANTSFPLGYIASANGNAYICATPGLSSATGAGPASTSGAIIDGSVVWSYLSAAGGDINFSSVNLTSGNTLALSSYTYQVPGV